MILLAGCILMNREGHLLLLHRSMPGRVQWEIPGGKVEVNESPETAAIRELNEELGVHVAIDRMVGQRDFEEDDNLLRYTWYEAHILSGSIRIGEPEKFDAWKYWDPGEILHSGESLSRNLQNYLHTMSPVELTRRSID
jgi:8-oxo-dGTP diphosphatase